MKKLWILVLSLCLVLALAACSTQTNELTSDNQGTSAPVQSDNADESKENDQTDASSSDTDTPNTDADLNYNDSSSRSTKEQNDASCRPTISGSVENTDSYDTVIIGYPIWWGQAPKILYTFMESYDFSGKTVVPFCTSASSGVGSSATNLHSSADSATWLDGTRLSSNASDGDIEIWLSDLGLK